MPTRGYPRVGFKGSPVLLLLMPSLIVPVVDVHGSFVAAMAEFGAEGRGAPDDLTMIGDDIRAHAPEWADPAVFARFVAATREQALEDAPRREGWVPAAMLQAGLPVANRLGIDPALITCDVDNEASRKVIEGNGGILDGEPGGVVDAGGRTASTTPGVVR
jgi:hypothetical protein